MGGTISQALIEHRLRVAQRMFSMAEDLNIGDQELAELVGVAVSTLQRWRTGRSWPHSIGRVTNANRELMRRLHPLQAPNRRPQQAHEAPKPGGPEPVETVRVRNLLKGGGGKPWSPKTRKVRGEWVERFIAAGNQLNLRNEQLGELVGETPETIRNWRRGTTLPRKLDLVKEATIHLEQRVANGDGKGLRTSSLEERMRLMSPGERQALADLLGVRE